MTKEEKLEVASIIANAIVQTIKETNSTEPSKQVSVEEVMKQVEKTLLSKDDKNNACVDDDALEQELSGDLLRYYKCGLLSVYSKRAQLLSDNFIRSYASGVLKNYDDSYFFLERKFLKSSDCNNLNLCIKTSAAYYTVFEFVYPIVNPFFLKGKENILSLLLDVSATDIKEIIYCQKYVVVKSMKEHIRENMLLTQKDCFDIENSVHDAIVVTGGEAIQHMLSTIDLTFELNQIKKKYTQKKKILQKDKKRYSLIKYLVKNNIDPKKIMLFVLPVPQVDLLLKKLPKHIRNDIKCLYLSIAEISDRIKKLESYNAHSLIINNEKRMLQDTVIRLFDKSFKIYMCEEGAANVSDIAYDDSNATKGKSLFALTDDIYGSVWRNFIAMLFGVEICCDPMELSLFHDFLLSGNSVEDNKIWENM